MRIQTVVVRMTELTAHTQILLWAIDYTYNYRRIIIALLELLIHHVYMR